MDDTTMQEARELASATESVLESATDAAMGLHALGVIVDRRTDDAEARLASECDPNLELVHDHISDAKVNLLKLRARLDAILPEPGPGIEANAW